MRSELERIQWLDHCTDQSVLTECQVDFRFNGCATLTPGPAAHLKQVHSKNLYEVKEAEAKRFLGGLEGDGLYTWEPGIVVGVRTADCLPLILACSEAEFVCVVHAGWRGLFQGIVSEAVEKAKSRLRVPTLRAYLGPCISSSAFEVGPDLIEALELGSIGLSEIQKAFCLSKGRQDRWHFDLGVAAAFELLNAGLLPEQISILRSCTYGNEELWHSYRRTGRRDLSNWTIASIHSK